MIIEPQRVIEVVSGLLSEVFDRSQVGADFSTALFEERVRSAEELLSLCRLERHRDEVKERFGGFSIKDDWEGMKAMKPEMLATLEDIDLFWSSFRYRLQKEGREEWWDS